MSHFSGTYISRVLVRIEYPWWLPWSTLEGKRLDYACTGKYWLPQIICYVAEALGWKMVKFNDIERQNDPYWHQWIVWMKEYAQDSHKGEPSRVSVLWGWYTSPTVPNIVKHCTTRGWKIKQKIWLSCRTPLPEMKKDRSYEMRLWYVVDLFGWL